MSAYRLVLRADHGAELRTIEFDAVHLAEAIAFVEKQGDFVYAEIWRGEELLCKVDASPDFGKIWNIVPPKALGA